MQIFTYILITVILLTIPFLLNVFYVGVFIEVFYPTFHYIKGVDNVVADALSCLPIEASSEVGMIQHDVDPDYNAEVFSIELDNESLLECFLHQLHLPDEIVSPLDYLLLQSR